MATQHKAIEIDPAKFADRVPKDTDTGEYIFDEADVLKFLIDEMNAAKINIAMITHNHDMAIEYQGRREYFGMSIASLDLLDGAVIDGMAEISNLLNDQEGIESWTAYKNGKYALHIQREPYPPAIEETPYMTPLEIREAEENIEASE